MGRRVEDGLLTATARNIRRKRSVGCSPDQSIKEEEYRPWLSSPLALYAVDSAKLAPGQRAPNGRT
ncbi:MAG: hypothetical protein ACK53K_07000 [Burkholderiales bacterium]